MCLRFLLNTLNKELNLGLEHFTLVGRLRQPAADWSAQCFLLVITPYLNKQRHLPTHSHNSDASQRKSSYNQRML